MAQNQPLAGNDAVREYLDLLMEARPEAGREYAALLFEMDGMHRRLDTALRELAQVRGELARMQECPEKGFLTHAMEAAGKRLSAMRQGILEMKEQLINGAKEAVEGVRKSGIKALDKAVSAVGIKKGLEEMQQSLAGSIEYVRKSIEKVEVMGQELRSVGGHLKNAGRAALGREHQEVDGGMEGRFQAAILAPLRKERGILNWVNNLVLAAIGSVECLEREAEKARENKQEKTGEPDRTGAAGETNRGGPDRPDSTRVAGRREPELSGNAGTADKGESNNPDRARGTDQDGRLQGKPARPVGARETAREGSGPPKPSVLKDIQERKRETAARSAPAPGRHLKAQEAAL